VNLNDLDRKLTRMERKLDSVIEEVHSTRHVAGQIKYIWTVIFAAISGMFAVGWQYLNRS
jgi:hypothetical protein